MKAITYKPSAARELAKLPEDMPVRLMGKLARYVQTGQGDVTRLTGQPHARLRVGDYRIVFAETEAAIDMIAVGHRREIYR